MTEDEVAGYGTKRMVEMEARLRHATTSPGCQESRGGGQRAEGEESRF
jgi:hypothetical protein